MELYFPLEHYLEIYGLFNSID